MPTNSPTISVIMATYNQAATLPLAIESVLNQNFKDFELIIINDGSTDNSQSIIHSYLDARIITLDTPNKGQDLALNQGISLSRGSYLAFIDSDDEYLPDHLFTLFQMCQTQKLDFALGKFELILCNEQNVVLDFYNPQQSIPIEQVECITGVLFGKKQTIINAGSFKGKFLDIGLFDQIKKMKVKWGKSQKPTYRYYFGRYEDNLSKRILLSGKTTKSQ